MKKTQLTANKTIVYQTGTGAVKLRADFCEQEMWATQAQMAALFAVKVPAISKHLSNIYDEGELSEKATVSKMETVQNEGGRQVMRQVVSYNLDAIIAVGYRISSGTGTKFRQWATKVLHQHITDGYTINKTRLAKNYESFLKAVEDVKRVLPAVGAMDAGSAVELVKMFAETWLSLSAYDKAELPKSGSTKKRVTSWSRTIRSSTATNAAAPSLLCGFSSEHAFLTCPGCRRRP